MSAERPGFLLPAAWRLGVVLGGGSAWAWWALAAWVALHAPLMTRLFDSPATG